MTRENVVEVEGVEKTFRDFWQRPKVEAVRGVSFEIKRGEVFGLLGPNGSGKSTTIKMILGLLRPTAGKLTVLGRPPRDVKVKQRIGYLPEESYLYPYLSSEETLEFYGKLFNLAGDERRRRIDDLFEMAGLSHARKRLVGEFSKGMARRIGLAQALINDPDLVLLDEPTSGLDPLGCRQIKDLILLLAARGKSVLLSSHLLADVEDVCDRIAILYNGKIQAAGPMREMLEERDRHQITLPDLPKEKLQETIGKLRELIGGEPELGHPRKNLEEFFLEVIAKARGLQEEDSGATPVESIGGFLSDKSQELEERD
jgi:ABC-2 type transport system ATP-binding protein